MLANLHTHTFRCKHATGDAADYARAAAAGGLAVLGMADHAPLPDRRWSGHRMDPDQLDGYMAAVRKVDQPGVRVLLGLECDWDPAYREWYADEILGRRGFDYLIVGCHFFPDPDAIPAALAGDESAWFDAFSRADTVPRLRAYVAQCERSMASGLFRVLTHPDVFGLCNPRWTADCAAAARDIADCAEATGTALELNAYGLRKPPVPGESGLRPGYPWPPFWEAIAGHRVRVSCASDAHRPQDLLHGFRELAALRDRCGLHEMDPWWEGSIRIS